MKNETWKIFALLNEKYFSIYKHILVPGKRITFIGGFPSDSFFPTNTSLTMMNRCVSYFYYSKESPSVSEKIFCFLGSFFKVIGDIIFSEKKYLVKIKELNNGEALLFFSLYNFIINKKIMHFLPHSKKSIDILNSNYILDNFKRFKEFDYRHFLSFLEGILNIKNFSKKYENNFFESNKKEISDFLSSFMVEEDKIEITKKFFKFLSEKKYFSNISITLETVPFLFSSSFEISKEEIFGEELKSSETIVKILKDSLKEKNDFLKKLENADKKIDEILKEEDFTKKEEIPKFNFSAEAIADLLQENNTSCSHQFISLKEENIIIRDEKYISEKIDCLITKNSEIINETLNRIEEIKKIKESFKLSGFQSGKFEMNNYIKGDPLLKCFSRRSAPEEEKDLFFYCLLDQSGSMGGPKAELSTKAMVILYESLSRLEIPFEYSCFTASSDDTCAKVYTYQIKREEDEAVLCKKYLLFSDNNFSNFYLTETQKFLGNQEDNNLFFILKKMKDLIYKNKFLIVLCDGATCGEGKDRILPLLKSAEEDGIFVLGIGIQADISHQYKNNIILRTEYDLKKFPEIITEFLVKAVTE